MFFGSRLAGYNYIPYICIINNAETHTKLNTMEIKVTPSIREEILNGIEQAKKTIAYEMGFDKDLRNIARIKSYQNYIKDMFNALNTGILN